MGMIKTSKKCKKQIAWDDRIFDIVCNTFLVIFVILVFYPLYFVLVASFTKPVYVNTGDLLLWPKEWTFLGYQNVFSDPKVWQGYLNTIIYTVGGTLLGTVATMLAGYALSRKDLVGRNGIMMFFVFTMYFSGGLIPLFLVINSMGLVNTRMIIMLLGAFSVYNMIVVRSFMVSTIPDELFEAAVIDGCGNGRFFAKIVLPLSKAVMAVIVLYLAVSYWNSYFNAMVFLKDADKYPLQLYLRQVLLVSSKGLDPEIMLRDPELANEMRTAGQLVKYCMIVVATAPILAVYPFLQKYFMKGVMIGSVKG